MNSYIKAILAVGLISLVGGCTSTEFRQMMKAERVLKYQSKELAKKYEYECSIEAAQLYPAAIATYDKEVFEMGQFKSGGTGTYDASCSKGYGFGDVTCTARERQGMTYERGKTKTITESYDANAKARSKHAAMCALERVKNNPSDMGRLKPYMEALDRAKKTYRATK